MRNLVYSYSVSLDGYIEGLDGQFDWSIPSEELHRYFNDLEHRFDTHLYGRHMWELMAEFWPTADQNTSEPDYVRAYAPLWRNQKKYVVSTTLERAEGAEVIKDNVYDEVRKLKEEPGKDISLAGSVLAQSLIREDLVDEYMIFVRPIILGGGKPMFKDQESPHRLRLVEVRHFNDGTVLLHYRTAD